MLSAREVMQVSKIIPVISVDNVDEGLQLCEALKKGGIDIFEITLRTPEAYNVIESLSKEFPSSMVGAGTVLNAKAFERVENLGAKFAISPGLTQELANYNNSITLLPGVGTASEIMQGLEYGYDAFKLFPADIVGGVKALKSFYPPFKDVVFCPTGGVNKDNFREYLALENVLCVGGSWIVPRELIKEKRFDEITKLVGQLEF
jgi:2-dehydro-3-deoxyphosphogluconate aldolase/(4S)-4-hydroxy-2-oxoglutarate aldolase